MVSLSPGCRSAIRSIEVQVGMQRKQHDGHAGLLRLRPQPVDPAFGEQRPQQRPMKSETQSQHAGLLSQFAISPRDSGASGSNRPMTAKRSGCACAAASTMSLRSPSQDGGTSTARSTPALSISRSRSSLVIGCGLCG